jgi:hypothetical protein
LKYIFNISIVGLPAVAVVLAINGVPAVTGVYVFALVHAVASTNALAGVSAVKDFHPWQCSFQTGS